MHMPTCTLLALSIASIAGSAMIQVFYSPAMALVHATSRHNCLAADALVRCAERVGCGCCTTVASLRRKELRWSQPKAWRSRELLALLP